MKFIVDKAVQKEIKYKAGDILSLGNPYTETHYLLIKGSEGQIGAVNLISNELEYYYPQTQKLDTLVNDILKEKEWDEWVLIKSDNVTMKLDCKECAMEQRNQSSPQFSSIERQSVDELF